MLLEFRGSRSRPAVWVIAALSIARLARIATVIASGVGSIQGPSHAAESPRALTTLRAVGESFLEPGPRGPVDVEAVVTGYLPGGSIALRDDTGATFASSADREVVVEPGDRVRVRGTVREGAFINGIAAETLERAWRAGATLAIESSPRSGTRVVVAVDAGRSEGEESHG